MEKLTTTTAWCALNDHFQAMQNVHLRDLFLQDNNRFAKFSLNAADLLCDFSKNHITDETVKLLTQLADQRQLPAMIDSLFSGTYRNNTEQRYVFHPALRHNSDSAINLSGINVSHEIDRVKQAMAAFCQQIHSGSWRGFDGQVITDIVNIGIGGSDLGPSLVTEALAPYQVKNLRCHYVANIDGFHIYDTLNKLNPATTLFIITSKSFTTKETLINTNTAKAWLASAASSFDAADTFARHFVAVTANITEAMAYGFASQNIFPLWDWIGGRYSLWSAVGLPIAVTIGMDNFNELLAGGLAMDQHFRSAPFKENMPVLLALIGIWYNNFFHAKNHAVLPYDQRLRNLPAHLQQLDMESNGKSVTVDGEEIDYSSGPIIWGGVGSQCQHAFLQLLHQGKQLVPCDFIVVAQPHHELSTQHLFLMASCFSQSQALMQGKSFAEAFAELIAAGHTSEIAESLAKHQKIPGNRPSNTLILSKLLPRQLGSLLAMYEHKVFVQGAIWGINSFDQWGVELGKQLGQKVLPDLVQTDSNLSHDCSTNGLINYVRSFLR